MHKWIHRIQAAITRSLFYDINNDLSKTILVAGSARSGTTWLAELINQRKEYRLIFEPFLGEKVPIWKPYNLRHFNPPQIPDKDLNNDLKYILSGSIRNRWTDSLNLKIKCDKRIVKAVRINLLIPYLLKHFPEVKIVFIHRKPMDVISSRLTLNWEDHLQSILEQDSFLQQYFPQNIAFLKSLKDPIEKHAAFWVLENYPILNNQYPSDQLIVVNYDLLNIQDSTELEKISRFLNSTLAYANPFPSQSFTIHKKRVLTDEEKAKIQNVINRFL